MVFRKASFFPVSHATGEVRQHVLESHFISRPGLPVDISWLCIIAKACCWNAPSSLLSFTFLLWWNTLTMQYQDSAPCEWLLFPASLLPSESCSCLTHFNINMDSPSNNMFSSWPSYISLLWLYPGLDHHAPYDFIIWILTISFSVPPAIDFHPSPTAAALPTGWFPPASTSLVYTCPLVFSTPSRLCWHPCLVTLNSSSSWMNFHAIEGVGSQHRTLGLCPNAIHHHSGDIPWCCVTKIPVPLSQGLISYCLLNHPPFSSWLSAADEDSICSHTIPLSNASSILKQGQPKPEVSPLCNGVFVSFT